MRRVLLLVFHQLTNPWSYVTHSTSLLYPFCNHYTIFLDFVNLRKTPTTWKTFA